MKSKGLGEISNLEVKSCVRIISPGITNQDCFKTCMFPKGCVLVCTLSHGQLFCDRVDCNPPGPLSSDPPGKNSGAGCPALLQEWNCYFCTVDKFFIAEPPGKWVPGSLSSLIRKTGVSWV